MSDNLKPKPAFKIPLPIWAQVLLLFAASTGIVIIAGIHIADCVQRHG